MLEILQEQIENGLYKPGKRLPSERKLAAEFQVPQSQVHRKLQQLVADGLLECFRGNGYFLHQGKTSDPKLHRIAFCWENLDGSSVPAQDNFYAGLLFNLAPEYALHVTPFPIPQTEEEQRKLFRKLLREGFEGIICFPHFISSLTPEFLEIKKQNIPLIFWDYSPLPGIFPSVGQDHFGSCMLGAKILAAAKRPVNAIGFEGKEQNRLKKEGFHAGCTAYGVPIESELYLPYEELSRSIRLPDGMLSPGKLYFTMTRRLSGILIGRMLDCGYLPGRDYGLLTIDRVKFMEGSSLQLDSVMRNQRRTLSRLLEEMQHAIENPSARCIDWRDPMDYVPGNSLNFPQKRRLCPQC